MAHAVLEERPSVLSQWLPWHGAPVVSSSKSGDSFKSLGNHFPMAQVLIAWLWAIRLFRQVVTAHRAFGQHGCDTVCMPQLLVAL